MKPVHLGLNSMWGSKKENQLNVNSFTKLCICSCPIQNLGYLPTCRPSPCTSHSLSILITLADSLEPATSFSGLFPALFPKISMQHPDLNCRLPQSSQHILPPHPMFVSLCTWHSDRLVFPKSHAQASNTPKMGMSMKKIGKW